MSLFRSLALFLTINLLAALAPGSSDAELTPGTPAPDFTGQHVWINSKPLSLKRELKGKVVLVDFWEYTCINCIRTLPALKRIYDRYKPYGFEIIGDHAPEFDFAYKPENVAMGTRRQRIPWPVIVDSDFSIWRAYDSNSWPNKFLIGSNGIIALQHAGEGGYGRLEQLIRSEIRKANPKVVFPASWQIPADTNDFDPARCGATSEETYVGTARGSRWGGAIANREGFQPGKDVLYTSTPRAVPRGFSAHGLWRNEADDLEHARATPTPKDYIGIRYHGREVYAVMNLRSGSGVRVYVSRDGKPVPTANRGVDVKADPRGRTYIDVSDGRMYYVIQGEDDGQHDLRLLPTAAGLAVNSFTFGNRCLTNFERL
ncbi:MAG TPA: redoxin domain-containing protein [Candidatus Eisenbacteria bacterium]